jgi:radical SAM superfamily enzyme YgiQ (UPF0313 family)
MHFLHGLQKIKEELDRAAEYYGSRIRTLFFPAGNTIAMPTEELGEICRHARAVLPKLERITVYGSSRYVHQKGVAGLRKLKACGLTRIHVGLESGDDEVLRRIKKGTNAAEQIEAGLWVREAGLQLSEYVVLGIGGKERSGAHAAETARVLSAINPDFIRFRTFLPKINTLLLHQIQRGRFQVLTAHEVLREARQIIENLDVTSEIHSDHYTNYCNIHGTMPTERGRMLNLLDQALEHDEGFFRPVYVGNQ